MKIILKSLVATCLVLFSLSALGGDHPRSNSFVMLNAGTLNVGIMQLQFATNVPEPISIIEERSLGTLGRADLKTLARVIQFGFSPEHCPDGFPTPVAITEDTVVLTFHDLSQLVGNGQTFVCVGPDGTQGIRGEGHWSSGTRRFANVTGGKFRLSSTATPESANSQFYSTVGSITGRLERHR
ncbi:MAG: hypothetical protein QNJ00_03910 [Woeseiaceae bacterium]|nr:hypothetical protein [Woeseiaceae bacterium]